MDVRQAIQHAANKLGGADRLYKWAKANKHNEEVFWAHIYPKLLPHTVNAMIGLDVTRHDPADALIKLRDLVARVASDDVRLPAGFLRARCG